MCLCFAAFTEITTNATRKTSTANASSAIVEKTVNRFASAFEGTTTVSDAVAILDSEAYQLEEDAGYKRHPHKHYITYFA